MASSDRPLLVPLDPVDCYAGMFGEPADIRTGWGHVPAMGVPVDGHMNELEARKAENKNKTDDRCHCPGLVCQLKRDNLFR